MGLVTMALMKATHLWCLLSVFLLSVNCTLQCDLKTGICSNNEEVHVGNCDLPQEEFSLFVQKLVPTLSLREKIGQMTQLQVNVLLNSTDFNNGIVSLNQTALEYGIKNYGVGSYFDSPYSGSEMNGKSGYNASEFALFINQIKQLAKQYSNSSLPIIYGLDSVHGANYVYGATMFPHNLGLAATFNPTMAKEGPGKIGARDTRLAGISWQFAPVMGIGVNPLWPRVYETFGEDPYLAGIMGRNVVEGIEGDDLDSQIHCSSCVKHFFGYPDPKSGKDRTAAWIGQRQLLRYFLPPFQEALPHSQSVMINSGLINGVPVHSSKEDLTKLLRNDIGFSGVAVTDYQDIQKLVFYHRLVETYKEAALLAIEAGIDMSMVPLDYSFCDDVYQLVQEGKISEARIDQSVMRIMQLKENLGLFGDNYLADPYNPLIEKVGSQQDLDLATQAGRESITLLKNKDNLLPLPKNLQKILVTGPAGNSLGALSGGWSLHWQGAEDDEFPYGVTIFEAISNELPDANVVFNQGVSFTEEIDIDSVITDAQGANVIILCLGEAPESEFEGDINDLVISAPQMNLYLQLSQLNIPIVLALVEARPRVLGEIANSDAIFMCYLPGPMGGQAFSDLLFGNVSPSGRLPLTYPAFTGDIGVSYYHLYSATTSPLYEFGHGLSYSTFSYSNLQFASQWTISSNPELSVSVAVSNTGAIAADEVVLLYVSDLYCTVSPEVKMLRRFNRIHLASHGSTTLQWTLNANDISFINRALQPAIEEGLFTLTVGNLTGNFTLNI